MGAMTIYTHHHGATCGRPIGMWMIVQCCIWLAFLIWNLTTSALLCMDIKVPAKVDALRYGLNFIIWLGWWIAGMVIFFNKHNDCGTNAATHGMHNLVMFVLIFYLAIVSLIACCIPTLILVACATGGDYLNAIWAYFVVMIVAAESLDAAADAIPMMVANESTDAAADAIAKNE